MTSSREYHLLRTYGITLAQYNQLLKKQKNSCGVCGRHKSEFKTNLAVDHDHQTKLIRGLCCNFCNRRVIGRHRDPELFRRAAEYLSQDTGWVVPDKRKKRKRRKKS